MANIFALPRESRPDEDVDVSLPAMLEEDRRFQRLIRFSLCWAVRSDCMAKTLDLLHDDETYFEYKGSRFLSTQDGLWFFLS